MTAAIIAVLLVVAAPPAPPAPYEPAARAEYLQQALDAVGATKPDVRAQAYRHVASLEASTCASQFDRLTVDCLLTAGRRWCKSRPKGEAATCPLMMDVVISNVLSEKEHISTGERYAIMRENKDHRGEIARRIRRVQATIAADFEVRTAGDRDEATLPERIDDYCLRRSDESDLSWPSCTATLVWFIGTEE